MELITCHHEWVFQCQLRYRADLPKGYWWEQAHHPLSEKQGGTNTERLWYPDHIVHGALQTLNTDYPCIHGYRTRDEVKILSEVYPEYLDIYEKATQFCKRFGGQRAHQLNVGCHDRESEAWFEYRESGEFIKNSTRGGETCLKKNKGIFNPDYRNSEKYAKDRKQSGQKSAQSQILAKTGIFSPGFRRRLVTEKDLEVLRANSKQRWQCTVTGKISNAGALASYQKARGIDPSNRIKLSDNNDQCT